MNAAWALERSGQERQRSPRVPTQVKLVGPMGKDRRKEKAEEAEALGKKADKFGKKGDGKIAAGATAKEEKSFTHQTCRHILVQKQGEALRISQEIHEGKISFNEAAFQYSEDKAGAHGLLGDKAQNEVRLLLTRVPPSCPLIPAPPRAAGPRLLGCGADLQGGRLAARAGQDAVGLAPHHGAGADNQEEEVSARAAWSAAVRVTLGWGMRVRECASVPADTAFVRETREGPCRQGAAGRVPPRGMSQRTNWSMPYSGPLFSVRRMPLEAMAIRSIVAVRASTSWVESCAQCQWAHLSRTTGVRPARRRHPVAYCIRLYTSYTQYRYRRRRVIRSAK